MLSITKDEDSEGMAVPIKVCANFTIDWTTGRGLVGEGCDRTANFTVQPLTLTAILQKLMLHEECSHRVYGDIISCLPG